MTLDQIYDHFFAEFLDSHSPGLLLQSGSLADYFRVQQDSVVCNIVPDNRRCDWYGTYPGWACDPEGNPWRVNIFDMQSWTGFIGSLEAQGLDLSDRGPTRPVLFLLSGNHLPGHTLSYPHSGFAVSNLWYEIGSGDGLVRDYIPVGYLAKMLLQVCGNLRETGFDPVSSDSRGSGAWDLMAEGEIGAAQFTGDYADIHFPAPLNPVDRLRLGWAQDAVELYLGGGQDSTYAFNLDQDLVYWRNPFQPEEMMAFQAFANQPGDLMAHYPASLVANGRGLVYQSHGNLVQGVLGEERVPELIRSELLPLGPGRFAESHAPFPSENNSLLDRGSWSSADSVYLDFYFSVQPDIHVEVGNPLDSSEPHHIVPVETASLEVPMNLQEDLVIPVLNLGGRFSNVEAFVLDDSPDFCSLDPVYGDIDGAFNFHLPLQSFQVDVPQHSIQIQESVLWLGRTWTLDLNVRSRDIDTGNYRDNFMTVQRRIGPPRRAVLPMADPQWRAASSPDALVLLQNGTLDVYGEGLVHRGSLTPRGEVLDFFCVQAAGPEHSPEELLVITADEAVLYDTGPQNAPQPLSGWPISLVDPGPAMVFAETAIAEETILALVDGDELLLRSTDGTPVDDARQQISLPQEILPVTHLAYAGGDALGPRFLLGGGPDAQPALALIALDGTVLLEVDPTDFAPMHVDWQQLLCADFLHNGLVDCAVLALTEQPGLQPDQQVLLLLSWSESEQTWGYSARTFAGSTVDGHGPQELLPLPGHSAWEPTGLLFHSLDRLADGIDQGGLRQLDLSDPLWPWRMESPQTIAANVPQTLWLLDHNEDGEADLLRLREGLGLDLLLADESSYDPLIEEGQIHLTDCRRRPVPLMQNGSLHLLLQEDGELVCYDLLTSSWPLWHELRGPGHAGHLPVRGISGPTAPALSIQLAQNRPRLVVSPLDPPVSGLQILRSPNSTGAFPLHRELPWDGSQPLVWDDESMSQLQGNWNYRVRPTWDYPGPDGSLYHD